MAVGFSTAALALTALPTLARSQVVLVAGDIAAGTAESREAATADLIMQRTGMVLTAGDNAQKTGSLWEFRNWYHPTWGRFMDRTYPAPGNHDYRTPGARGYFRYFGPRAGPDRRGYYSLDVRGWRVVSLDSEPCMSTLGCGPGTPQYEWLDRLLTSSTEPCTLAVWHRPLFSSSSNGGQPRVRPLFALLYRHGAEIVVNGHDHHYERLSPVRPDGGVARRFGIRQFIVGTGGATLGLPRGRPRPEPHSEVFERRTHGVLKLTLHPDSYAWRFLPIEGQSFTDTGTAPCHGKPT